MDILLTLSFNESAYYCQALLSGGIPASQEPLWQAPPHQGPFKFILSFCPFLPTSERFRKYFEAAGEHAPGRAVLVHGSKDKISTAEARDEVARLVRAEDCWLHDGGHDVPRTPQITARSAEWLQSVAETELGIDFSARPADARTFARL